jgi:hypothetical protein
MDLRYYSITVEEKNFYEQALKEANQRGLTRPEDKIAFRVPYSSARKSGTRYSIEQALMCRQSQLTLVNKKIRAKFLEIERKLPKKEKDARLLIKKNN